MDEQNLMDIHEDPLYEEPLKTGEESITKTVTPKGTYYNKKTVLLVGALIITAFIVLFVMSSLSVKPVSNTALEEENTEGTNLTPDELKQVEASYQNLPQITQPSIPNYQYGQTGNDSIFELPPPNQPISLENGGYGGNNNNGPSPEELERQERVASYKSPMRFGNMVAVNNNDIEQQQQRKNTVEDQLGNIAGMLTDPRQLANAVTGEKDQNMQDEKRNFISQSQSNKFYAKSVIVNPISKYEVKAGTIIPVTLITGINSNLPGMITAQVSENVYDTVTGRYLLIPQGTRVIGSYNSQVAYAQDRVQVIWTRLIFPNGNSLDLESLQGTDQSGYTGLKDRVNNHYGKMFGGVLLSSVLATGAKRAVKGSDDKDVFAQSLSENVMNVGSKITEKNINIQPTIEVRPGFKFNLFVDKDFIISPYK